MAATGTSSPSLLAHWPPWGHVDPGSVGRRRERGVREGREAFGGGGEPWGPDSQLAATKIAPSAGCPSQCKMTPSQARSPCQWIYSARGFTSEIGEELRGNQFDFVGRESVAKIPRHFHSQTPELGSQTIWDRTWTFKSCEIKKEMDEK